MVWYRPTKAELDKLEELGNPGWNWDSLEPYIVAAEMNIPPDAAQVAQGAGWDPDVHGYHGFVNTSFRVRLLPVRLLRSLTFAEPVAHPDGFGPLQDSSPSGVSRACGRR
jgi:choline dehydrogenase-like flavoprotein